MSVSTKYKDQTIAQLTESGTVTLKTGGKYCEGDVVVEYAKPAGGNAEMFSSSASGWIPEYQVGHAVSVLEVSTDMFTSSAIGSLVEETTE